MSSNAVAQNRIASVTGYQLTSGNFGETTENLPQVIGILGEANTANQSGLTANAPQLITSASQAATLYGAGSPIHAVARILFPVNGGGTNAPVYVFPQAAAGGSVARVQTLTVTATVTAGGIHTLVVAGRRSVDGQFYNVNIVSTDTASTIAGKIRDSINAVAGSPFIATASSAVVTLTTKWTGLTSETVGITVDTTLAPSIGVTYAVAETVAGTGTPAVTPALNLFGSMWITQVINCYGTVSATLTELEAFNGVPGLTGSTGRYQGIVFKPFIALTGSVADDPSSVTTGRSTQCTIAICPAPQSPGMQYEAAANVAVLASNTWINAPQSDIVDQYYPDMPVPAITVVPSMQSYTFRDTVVQVGCSTAVIENGTYKMLDFVTTFYDGTMSPSYRYCRDLDVDFNIAFGMKLIEVDNVKGKTICKDSDVVSADNIIKPKMLTALIYDYIDQLVNRALIADAKFSKSSTTVSINQTNPNRLDDTWSYKRTGIARIVSTTVQAGFNFSN